MSISENSSKNSAQIVPENSSNLKFFFHFVIFFSYFRLTDILVGCGGFRAKVSKFKNIFQQLFSFQLKFKKRIKRNKNLILSQKISLLLSNNKIIIPDVIPPTIPQIVPPKKIYLFKRV